jgi:AraC family transcriptional regulator
MKQESILFYKEAINRAIDFVERNLNQPIYLDDIAKEAHLSKFHFHRIFKELTGETASEFLMRIRIEKSALLLTTSDSVISDIAFACGFNSIEHFSRTFSNYFSESPTDYRERKNEIQKQKLDNIKPKDVNIVRLATPETKIIDQIKVAYIRHTGAYDEVDKVWKRLIQFAFKNFLVFFKVKMIGIVHDSPKITDEQRIRYDACIAVRKEIKPKGEIGYKVINGGKYAVFKYKGAYQKIGEAYHYIYTHWLLNSTFQLADEPAFEMYLNSPNKEKPENLLTDIYIPIQ